MDLEHPVEIALQPRAVRPRATRSTPCATGSGEAMAADQPRLAGARGQGGRAHRAAAPGAPAAAAGGPAGLAGAARGERRPRDQQPALRRPQLLGADGAHPARRTACRRERVPEFRAYLERVSEQTARAGRIVSDLLAFSRRSKPHRAPADLERDRAHAPSPWSRTSCKLMGVEAELRLDEAPARSFLRRLPGAAGRAQPGDERAPRRRAAAASGRVTVRTRALGRRAGRSRSRSSRRRRGDRAREPRPHLRPVLHDEGGGQGPRARPGGRLRHRAGARRHDRRATAGPGAARRSR